MTYYIRKASRACFAVFSNVFMGPGVLQKRRCGMRSKIFRSTVCIAIGFMVSAALSGSAQEPPISPTDIAGLEAWYQADNIINGTEPANGSTVTSWFDSSGNGKTVTGGSPTFVDSSTTFGNMPVVSFDGINDLLTSTATLTGQTIIIIADFSKLGGYKTFTSSKDLFNMNLQAVPGENLWRTGMPVPVDVYMDSSTPHITTTTGNQQFTMDLSSGPHMVALTANSPVTDEFQLARERTSGGFAEGDIAEVIIYDNKLNAHQINDIGYYLQVKYNLQNTSFTAPTITVAYWDFDSNTESAGLTDSVGSYDLSIVAGTFGSSTNAAVDPVPNPDTAPAFSGDSSANPDSGITNASLRAFGGASQDYLTVPNDPGTVFNLSGKSFTFEGWFQHDAGSTPSGFGDIIGGTRNAGAYRGYLVKMPTGGQIQVYFQDDTANWTLTTSGTYNDGAFHHFALIWQDGAGDNSTGLAKLYIDGGLQATGSAPAGWSASAADGGDQPFIIAGRGAGSDNTWAGRFDEFRFSSVALAPSELLSYAGPPVIITLSPENNATGFAPSDNLVATFNETIVTNTTGSIVITNLSDNSISTIAIGDTNQVTVSGKTLTINPTNDLLSEMSYAVLIDNNALMDASGNSFAGIMDDTTWVFTVAPLSITDLSPVNNATGVRTDSELVATFDRDIVKNTTGSIIISNRSDNSISTIAIGDTSQITVSDTTLTITPPVGLIAHTSYAVLIDTNALKDTEGKLFAGIPNATNWWFETGDHIPTVAYWVRGSSATLTDLSGSDQSLTGGNTSASSVSVAPNPIPNPDPVTTGSAGSIYFNNSVAPKITGAAADAFKITSTSSFTFEGWLKTTNGVGIIAGDRHNLTGYNGWHLIFSGSSLEFYAQTGAATSSIIGTTNVQDDTPHHFAVVWDHSAGYMRLYIDGTLQGTASHTPTSYNAFAFAIGGRATGSDGIMNDNLLISSSGVRLDALRFSNVALTSGFLTNVVVPPYPPDGTVIIVR